MNYPAFKTFTFYLFCGILQGMFLRILVVFLENVLDDNFLQALRRDAALVGGLLLSAGLGPCHPGCR